MTNESLSAEECDSREGLIAEWPEMQSSNTSEGLNATLVFRQFPDFQLLFSCNIGKLEMAWGRGQLIVKRKRDQGSEQSTRYLSRARRGSRALLVLYVQDYWCSSNPCHYSQYHLCWTVDNNQHAYWVLVNQTIAIDVMHACMKFTSSSSFHLQVPGTFELSLDTELRVHKTPSFC